MRTFRNSEWKAGAAGEGAGAGGVWQPWLWKKGVKRSVYLPVNQPLNPPSRCTLASSPCHQAAPSVSALLLLWFCFSWITGQSSASCAVWQVRFISHSSTPGVCQNANAGIRIMWLCTNWERTRRENTVLFRLILSSKSGSVHVTLSNYYLIN